MLDIFASDNTIELVREIIASEERLDELVSVHHSLESAPTDRADSLVVDARGISQPIDWANLAPPYLLPQGIPLSPATLLGLIFSKLDNGEKAWHYLKTHPSLIFETGLASRLQYGYEIDLSELTDLKDTADPVTPFEQYRRIHNIAIVGHYGYLQSGIQIETLKAYYQQALADAPNAAYRAYSLQHYAGFLLDGEDARSAEALLLEQLEQDLPEAARISLKRMLTDAWMKQLTVPYDQDLLHRLKQTLWEVLQYNEQHDRRAETGLLLIDAAHIANISESFSEALGYISRAIGIFESEELEELAGQAHLRKGTLLYTWAQQGNPQFYKPAIESYQQALKVFRQEETPDVFADIHHNLAVLYSEMPADSKKKGIWAGVASASFQEALQYYTKDFFPYEYGMICNNYGNALTKFPQAIHSDNYEKALFYYQEALQVRTAAYPYERAITLLNYLEASWKVSNDTDDFNEKRFRDMVAKAQEVKQLVGEADMIREADKHLELLEQLKTAAVK
ncbi:tetratricopeptide repeat protein [Flavilitoribacter nigricans]|uniref:Tetratricopeptide repeat protein n=1 Tax=Flavilitoribacter nigricans (strain ATCC 23147 / DSM 23189 / NBRC 102662 / NCIMB 1420 / SS-2) TaxID=1122177 RepID=A0A2D0N600_FLAN2|nr:hypothetical protein [Flavilitoribacter nigricans]PHN03820.1 hypothetical protein CRP01_25060 [Flavilitoribacter nigricans DSM 23189 = NBRC 102662]